MSWLLWILIVIIWGCIIYTITKRRSYDWANHLLDMTEIKSRTPIAFSTIGHEERIVPVVTRKVTKKEAFMVICWEDKEQMLERGICLNVQRFRWRRVHAIFGAYVGRPGTYQNPQDAEVYRNFADIDSDSADNIVKLTSFQEILNSSCWWASSYQPQNNNH